MHLCNTQCNICNEAYGRVLYCIAIPLGDAIQYNMQRLQCNAHVRPAAGGPLTGPARA